jgi:CobQ-like glutamine amidotransferase family enzyme/UDP-N-acetylmuramyl tripeptide synthase
VTRAANAPAPTTMRTKLAAKASVLVGSVSRGLGFGSGSVIGGRVGLIVDPQLLRSLATGRWVALVTGTNGKTTTTRLLCAALGGPTRVATSVAGANLPYGLAAALAAAPATAPAALEVDEGYLARVVEEVSPRVVVLLNLSRDQLDRVSEVRMTARNWRGALESYDCEVVANCDDPLVVWAAMAAPLVRWVAAGQLWHSDSVGCPNCEGRIVFKDSSSWACECGFKRPQPDAWLDDRALVLRDGRRLDLNLSIPGRFNLANAAMAAVASVAMGTDLLNAVEAMNAVKEVEGRFATVTHAGTNVRLLLAKNPAGWTELLELLHEEERPVVIGINARVADGHDPSWLWDVNFERLAGRFVVATGERRMDLAVRLRHAGVSHFVTDDQLHALRIAASQGTRAAIEEAVGDGEQTRPGQGCVDYIGNYTAFQQLRRALTADHPPRGASQSPLGSPAHPGAAAETTVTAAPTPTWSRRVRSNDGVSALRIVVVHPDLLGTYGDSGNGRVLCNRAWWRGIDAELVLASSDVALPASADLYCLGGGEDGPQVRSAKVLRECGLATAVEAGAVVLAVCAGFQIVGTSFPGADGSVHAGVGLLDVSTVKGAGPRAVGEIVADPVLKVDVTGSKTLEALTGFENHSGVTSLGREAKPLARVRRGVGNGNGDGSEGAYAASVFGTYMHGPVLARNPSLADLLLEVATGIELAPIDDAEELALRRERLASTSAGKVSGRRGPRVLLRAGRP